MLVVSSNTFTSEYMLKTASEFGRIPRGQVTEFNNDRYVRQLNKCLRLSLNAMRAYSATEHLKRFQSVISAHDDCCGTLRHLIIANSGIAHRGSDLSGEVSRALVQVTNLFPHKIQYQTNCTTFLLIEKKIAQNLKLLLKLAPKKDKLTVNLLYQISKRNLVELRK